jgi:hypothetical protein
MIGGSNRSRSLEFFSSPPRPERLWDPPSLLSDGYLRSFPGVKRPVREADYSPPSSAEVKECVELYLQSPNTPSWCGVQLKHRDNFTFTFTFRVGVALGYGLDDGDSRVRFPAGAANFSFHHRVQNGSGAHPGSYPMGTGTLSWG